MAAVGRPHHHACIFNFTFEDKILWDTRDGVKLYRSPSLEELWPFGFSTVGDVTYQSAAYVARYVMKKLNGKKAEQHYQCIDTATGEVWKLKPEFITMSRRPGIASDWIEQNISDCYPKDYTTLKGKKLRLPKYYDSIYDIQNPEGFAKIKKERLDKAKKNKENCTPERLKARKLLTEKRLKKLERTLENGD